MGYFFPFYPPNIAKNENLKIIKKPMEISSCYTSVPKIMIMCYTVPVMWCMMDIIIFHFGLFFALSPPLSQLKKWKSRKNKKKTPGDTIILQKSTKNHDHILYCSWDIAPDGCNCYFLFWAIFCPNSPKN